MGEPHNEGGEGAADGVNVGGDGGAAGGDFGGLEAGGAVDVAEFADGGDGSHVDELYLVLGEHNVFGFEVVVGEPEGVEVVEGGEDF